MKREVVERVRELACDTPKPADEPPLELERVQVTQPDGSSGLQWQPRANPRREQRLQGDNESELAVWLLKLFDENEAQALYTVRVLELVESRKSRGL